MPEYYNFTVSLGSVFFLCSTFCSILSGVFLFFCFWLCTFSSVDYCVLSSSFDIFVFHLVSIKNERCFQKNKSSSFNLGLIRFGYRGTFLFMLLVLWR